MNETCCAHQFSSSSVWTAFSGDGFLFPIVNVLAVCDYCLKAPRKDLHGSPAEVEMPGELSVQVFLSSVDCRRHYINHCNSHTIKSTESGSIFRATFFVQRVYRLTSSDVAFPRSLRHFSLNDIFEFAKCAMNLISRLLKNIRSLYTEFFSYSLYFRVGCTVFERLWKDVD